MRYEAKVDLMAGVGLAAGAVVPLIGAFSSHTPWGVLPACLVFLLVFGCLLPQWYKTEPDALVIRGGLITRRIPYAKISAIRSDSIGQKSFSWGSVALSRDIVRIEYDGRGIYIAPKDSVGFFDDLEARAPQLSRRGMDLVASAF